MAGDGLVPPLNAPPAGAAIPGVQPGVSQAIVVANRVIIIGANGGLFVYSGSPAAGNLIESITASGGPDSYGNLTIRGSVVYTPVSLGFLALQQYAGQLIWYLATTEAGPWTAIGTLTVNENGIMTIDATSVKVSVEADGNVYNVARLNLPMTPAGQTINQTSAATVNNMTADLASGVTYQFEAELQFTANASAGNPSFQMAVSATTSLLWGNGYIWQTSGSGAGANRYTADTSGALFQGPAMVSGAVYTVTIKGELVTTGTGAISLQAFTSNASDTFTINNGYMNLYPLA